VTEIRVDTDLPHPVERVWKALTDPHVIRSWFMPVEFDSDPPVKVLLLPSDVPGFDEPVQVEIVEGVSQQRIAMRWYASQLHTSVSVLLQPVSGGCRLTFVQRGFLGPQGTLRRRVLQRTYQEMAGPRLHAALDRLAEAERERANLIRRQTGAPGTGGSRGNRRNDARFLSSTRQAWQGLLRASRNMAMLRPPSDPGQRPLRHPPARGVAPPRGEALRESPTTPFARRFWPRRKRLAGILIDRRPGADWPAGGLADGERRRVSCRPSADGGAGSCGVEGPGQFGVPGRPLPSEGRRYRIAAGASSAILVLLTTLAILVDIAAQPGGPAAGADVIKITSGSQGASPEHSPGRSGTVPSPLAGDSGAARPPAVTLTAAYRTERHVVGGYEAIVTINNLSSQPVDGWKVRLVLPPFGLVVNTVQGARVEQTEREVVFTPTKASRVIPAGEPARFTFRVQGIGSPVECEINDQPCAGVPERAP
jgi:uncharacterized protein YndB with AHSA1/START domain